MSIPCDIVLLPTPEQSQQALHASRLLASQGSLFTLDNENFFAHTSLYMFQLELTNQQLCFDTLAEIAAKTPMQQLTQTGYVYQSTGGGIGYTDIAFERNEDVDALQLEVVSSFNSLRSGMRESDKNKMADATGQKLENLRAYGYPSVGELFRPHITLTRFPADLVPDLSGLPPATSFSGEFNRIGMFEMGQNGTCIRKLTEFKLG